jgi:hypothetical protein
VSSGSEDTFVLDTNVFIQAYRRYYALDLCPGFWESLEHYCQAGRLLSIDRVQAEINEGDALHEWVTQAPDTLFASTADGAVASQFAEMMLWVQENENFTEAAKSEFATVADGWLIAYAKVHGHVVVTHETFDPRIKSRVKIPNVCRQFDVRVDEPFSMLRSLGVTFSWP